MATAKFFLDNRRKRDNSPSPLRIAIRNNNKTAFFNAGISLFTNQWDAINQKVNNKHPNYKELNAYLSRKKGDIDVELLALAEKGGIKRLTATEIKTIILRKLNPEDYIENIGTFNSVMKQFMELKRQSTKGVYLQTLSRLENYTNSREIKFEEITIDWLKKFEAFLAKTASKNARNIHLRNIRAVFNYALDNEFTSLYPFRRFKIRPEETRKRSLTVAELREFINMEVEEYQQFYKDMFLLSFFLIGCNAVDMYGLSEITSDNRLEYIRAKTHRKYSIKVEPEALEIIEKYHGANNLLCIADRWGDHRNFVHQLNKALKNMGSTERVGRGGKKVRKPAFPELSSYWARHTWATVAYNECKITEDVIAQALGHASSHTTTNIYINRSARLVDEANRKVIDWVLYNKK